VIIHRNDQTVSISVPDEYDRIMISVSGGADSAMLMWIILKYLRANSRILKDITITTGVDTSRLHNEWNAREVFLAISEKFSEQNFIHDIFYYSKEGPKMKYHVDHEKKLKQSGIKCMYYGRTASPPKEIQQKITYKAFDQYETNMYDDQARPEDRDVETELKRTEIYWADGSYESIPFDNVDKMFIANLYKEDDYMMNVVYPLTASCISNEPDKTKSFSEPCRKCWWCQERYWAFGSYDGGVQ
jgi:hypothetical protein